MSKKSTDVGFPEDDEPKKPGNELSIPPPQSLDVGKPNEAASAFLAEAKGQRQAPKTLPIISISHHDAAWVMPSGELVEHVAGYPVYYFQTRKFYEKVYVPGSSAPPDCWSADLVKPHQDSLKKQSELCAECSHNQFGTGRDGKSKACGEMTWVFLLNPDFGQPPIGVLVLPPSSIRAMLGTRFSPGYFSRSAAKHQVYEIVWTQFGLEPQGDDSGRGVQYCVAAPVMGEAATAEKAGQIARIRNQFLEAFEKLRGSTASVEV